MYVYPLCMCIPHNDIRVTHMHTLFLDRENGVVLEAPYNPGQAQKSMSHTWLSHDIIVLVEKKLKNSCQK